MKCWFVDDKTFPDTILELKRTGFIGR